ncbi:MAG: hypothetical protein COB51_12065 [Moraxellaceae bacterium]|nr:MAG: hypothetical protein COB51_12065 [Moraxellaceae bacterium]
MDNTDKVVILVEECRAMEINLLSPDVNQGIYKFKVGDDDEIIYGLGAIKGVGEGPVEEIINARGESGKFQDLFELCRKVDLKKLNRRTLEGLIRAGAMDCFGKNRATLMASVGEAVKAAGQFHSSHASGMMDLFANSTEDVVSSSEYIKAPDWSDDYRLKGERETLGLFLSGHPIDQYENEIKHFISNRVVDLKPQRHQKVTIAGMVIAQRTMKSKRGDKLCFITLDDRSARIEVSVFSEVYEKHRELLIKDNILVIEGEVSQDDFSGNLKMRAAAIQGILQARENYAKRISMDLDGTQVEPQFTDALKKLLQPHNSGHCRFEINYQNGQEKARIMLGKEWRLVPDDQLVAQLRELDGVGEVSIHYQ